VVGRLQRDRDRCARGDPESPSSGRRRRRGGGDARGYERAYELAREHADALRAQDGLLAAELYGEGNNEVKKAHAAARELGFDDCSFLGVAR
jgi:hypothetical protein